MMTQNFNLIRTQNTYARMRRRIIRLEKVLMSVREHISDPHVRKMIEWEVLNDPRRATAPLKNRFHEMTL